MIVFAGVIPTNDLFLRNPKNITEKTLEALQLFRSEIERSEPETIVIISDRAGVFKNSYSLPFNTRLTESLKKFGIITTHISYQLDTALVRDLQSFIQKKHLSLRSVHTDFIDPQTAIAMRSLDLQKQFQMMTIGTSEEPAENHFEFGTRLNDFFHSHPRRIAIIACTEIPEIDSSKIEKVLIARDITKINDKIVAQKNIQNLSVMFGMIKDFPHQTQIISHEQYLNTAWIVAHLYSA
ncbi:MAG: hypothetical protein NT003_01435 [Candidatus Magasanikbacteria bacterium]|nr:hypothetical protein [Candidatus Magasanikbacteria bacterium]